MTLDISRLDKGELPPSVLTAGLLSIFDVAGTYHGDPTGQVDSSAAVLAALADAVAAGGGIIWLRPGVWLLQNAQQSGSAQGYSYSGQILLPAISFTSGRVVIVFASGLPAPLTQWQVSPGQPPSTSGAVILSNATSGNILDAIPSFTFSSTPLTNIFFATRNVTFRAPNDPQCGGLKLSTVAACDIEGTSIDVNASAGNAITVPTGAGTGLLLPRINNSAYVRVASSQVIGFPTLLDHSEHTVLDDVTLQMGLVGLKVNAGSGHMSEYRRLLIQECVTPIQAPNVAGGGGPVAGRVDVECFTAGNFATTGPVIDDAGSRLTGRLELLCTTAPTKGFQINGALNLNLANPNYGGQGWMFDTLYDTFTRLVDGNQLGCADQSANPWRAISGVWKTLTNKAQYVSGAPAVAVCRHYHRVGRGLGFSRIIEALITTATTYDVGVVVGRSNVNGNYLLVRLQSGIVSINKVIAGVTTSLASSAAATVAASTTYTVTTVFSASGTPTATWSVTVFINGVQAVTYSLTAAEVTNVLDNSTNGLQGIIDDGLWAFNDDVGSTVARYRVAPYAAAA